MGRDRQLDRQGVLEHLRSASPVIVIAAVGQCLRVVTGADVYAVWKGELAPRLVERDPFYLEDFPDGRAYRASRWVAEAGEADVLFEQHH